MSAFMDTKKSHEVDIMSYVCVHLFKSTGCQLVSTGQYKQLSYDVASGSEITPCNKICKPLVVYRFTGNVTTSITTLRT